MAACREVPGERIGKVLSVQLRKQKLSDGVTLYTVPVRGIDRMQRTCGTLQASSALRSMSLMEADREHEREQEHSPFPPFPPTSLHTHTHTHAGRRLTENVTFSCRVTRGPMAARPAPAAPSHAEPISGGAAIGISPLLRT